MENSLMANVSREKCFDSLPISKDSNASCEDDTIFFDASQVLEVSFQNSGEKEEMKMEPEDDFYAPTVLKRESDNNEENLDVLNGWAIENGNYVNKISEVELRPIEKAAKKKFTDSSTESASNQFDSDFKPFKCSVCGNGFTRKDHLRRHEQGHTGLTPYSCDECGKCFNRKDRLTRHLLIHTGDQQFQCDVCSKVFSRRDHMTAHRKSHEPGGLFICHYCNKTFSRKDSLVHHRRTHENISNGKIS